MSEPRDPVAEEGQEPEAPRREASATFAVHAPEAAEAAIRSAMDPANQSLADSLRLSYRLLQVAILGLLVTFLFSGFQTVQEGSTGVKLLFGRIVGDPGQEALAPGLTPFWPYPVGQVTSFESRRVVDLRTDFWPNTGGQNITTDQQVDAADVNKPIMPGKDGSVITGDGDLAHVQVTAEYVVEDPVRFLESMDLERSDAIVRAALRRGVVAAASRLSLQELVEQREVPAQMVQAESQRVLDAMASGLKVQRVTMPERSAPFAVRNQLSYLQKTREDARTTVEKARQEATGTLLSAAGPKYQDLLAGIDAYEAALASGDMARADAMMREIGQRLEGKDIAGAASNIVNRARSYQSAISAALAKDLRRLEGLRESFRQNPRQLARQLWLEAVRSVLDQREVEVFSLPPGTGLSQIAFGSSPEIMQARRNADAERRRRAREIEEAMLPSWNLGVRQIMINKEGRRLDAKGEKGFGRENK
ncbi:MAG: hypothetical protein EBQ99_06325 [Planctomycetes bacterium]|nr:hypothetical protein [Planctomycetota bacterium]